MLEAVPMAGGALDIGATIVAGAGAGALIVGAATAVDAAIAVGALITGALIVGAGALVGGALIVGAGTVGLLVLHADDHATTRPEPATPVSCMNWRRDRRTRVGGVGGVGTSSSDDMAISLSYGIHLTPTPFSKKKGSVLWQCRGVWGTL